MSEKFELIDAKDLPVTEEEDVTVLCVGADGEMKRRDAGSFGMKMSELAELPTTEAEEVDVICADAEGNLCRKPGASFGGGGADWIVVSDANNNHRLVAGDYYTLRDKLTANDPITGMLFQYNTDNYMYSHLLDLIYQTDYSGDMIIIGAARKAGYLVYLYEDGHVIVSSVD